MEGAVEQEVNENLLSRWQQKNPFWDWDCIGTCKKKKSSDNDYILKYY